MKKSLNKPGKKVFTTVNLYAGENGGTNVNCSKNCLNEYCPINIKECPK